MKINIKSSEIICSNPTNPLHSYFAWPSVTRLQNGRLAMVTSGFRRQHICPFGKVVMCISEDEGKTWSRPSVIIDTPLDDRDAGILPFGEKSVIVTSFNNTVEAQRYYSNFEEFRKVGNHLGHSPYVDAYLDEVEAKAAEERYLGSTFVISHDCGTTFGEVMRIPVSAPHGPALNTDGTLLYVGRVFSEESVTDPNSHVHAYRLFSDGRYEKLGEIADISSDMLSCEPHAIVLDDGTVIVHIRVQQSGDCSPYRIFSTYQSESYDGGRTFTTPHQILSDLGGAPAHLLKLRDGSLLSVYGCRNRPCGIKAMISRDGAKTWDVDHDIAVMDGESSDLGYPASVELENGDILTVYYVRKDFDSPAVIMQTVWNIER